MSWQKAARREDGAVGGGQDVGEDGGGNEGLSLKEEKVDSPNFNMAGPDQIRHSPSFISTAKHRYGEINVRRK